MNMQRGIVVSSNRPLETPQSKLWREVYINAFNRGMSNPKQQANNAVYDYNHSEYLED